MDLTSLPRVPLAHLPTPFEPMDALAERIDSPSGLFVKRDDCTGLAIGGNKTRKLEFTLADALERRADVLVTSGGTQSNHVRQTAAAASKIGLECHAVVSNPLAETAYEAHPTYAATGNRLLDDLFGCVVHEASGGALEDRIGEVVRELESAGRRPYVVPLGASDGVGSMGYAQCALELVEQCDRHGVDPSHVVLATGSAGTHAGLLAGLRAAGSAAKVVGIAVSETSDAKRAKVRSVLEQMAPRWPPGASSRAPDVTDDDIAVDDRFVGAGYAVPTEAGVRAMRLAARAEGLLLDPVYTAKAMAGLVALLGEGALEGARDVVFLHTGGAPGVFAYPELADRAAT
ncbi:MAG: D-cysteine desulfhydrase family protein [Planctomycetota bacterium]